MKRGNLVIVLLVCFVFVIFLNIGFVKGDITSEISCLSGGGSIIFDVSDTSNAHASVSNDLNYNNVACFEGSSVISIGSGNQIIKLSDTSNAHVGTFGSPYTTIISSPDLACTYESIGDGCNTGYSCVASISDTTNAHVSDCVNNPYSTLLCCTYVPIPGPCVLTDAYWDKTEVSEGEIVTLTIEGDNCEGKFARFSIKESDQGELSRDDDILIDFAIIEFTEEVASVQWTSVFHNDCLGACLPSEHYFEANLMGPPSPGGNIRSLNYLSVLTPCGNEILDLGETCDDGNNVDGDGCDSSCQDEVSGQVCGNDILERSEQCDGSLLNGATCISAGYDGGSLSCMPAGGGPMGSGCTFNTGGCTECGDGIVNGVEDCDDNNNVDGDGCENDCTFTPGVCGDGILGAGETCDDGNTVSGDGCSNICEDEDGSIDCGNDILEIGEICDGSLLNNNACSDFLPGSTGTLLCTAICTIDSSGCTVPLLCGNGVLDVGEECEDGGNVDGDGCNSICQCEDDNQGDGVCNPVSVCGNDILEVDEICDTSQLNGATCDDFVSGSTDTLLCTAGCAFDSSVCTVAGPNCGDGTLDAGEECDDGGNVDGDGCDASCNIEIPLGLCGDLSDANCENSAFWSYELLQAIETTHEAFADANDLDFDFCTNNQSDDAECGCKLLGANNCVEFVSYDHDGPGGDDPKECFVGYDGLDTVDCSPGNDEYSIGWFAEDINGNRVEDVALGCIDGSQTFQCPVRVQLPFFTLINMLISLSFIVIIYFVIRKDLE